MPPATQPAPPKGSRSRDPLVGRVVKGRYRVLRLLGHGAMGNVYEVEHVRLRTSFALKQLRAELEDEPEIVARFRHEAEMMARLAHPHVVRVFDIDTDPEVGSWMAMELVHGDDLGAVMRRTGRLPLGEALRIAAELAAALDCAHRAGLVHRDIKPANVLIETDTGRAVLTDFGIAKSRDHRGTGAATQSGVFLGTYRYSSPEQLRHQRGVQLDARADVYSLGVVLYEMVSGRKFLDGFDESEVLSEVGHRADWTPPLPFDEPPPPALAALIAQCLAPRRDDRVASAADVGARLAALAADVAPGTTLPSPGAIAATAPRDATAATIAPALPAAPGAAVRGLPTRAGHGGMRLVGAPRARRIGRTAMLGVLLAAVVAAIAHPDGLRTLVFERVGSGLQIRSVQPAAKLVPLTRSEPQWFSVVVDGADPEQPPPMRWYLNDKLVAEGTTLWEYEPELYLTDLTARGRVRFVVGSGRRPHQTYIWATETPTKDLSPVLQSASYKPGSTIDATAGQQIAIDVVAYDPDDSPLTFTWRVDGERVGEDAPRLVLDVAHDAKVTLAISDGGAVVTSSWTIVVDAGKS